MDQQQPEPPASQPAPIKPRPANPIYPEPPVKSSEEKAREWVKNNKSNKPLVADWNSTSERSKSGVPFGFALIAALSLPVAGTSLMLELFSSSTVKLGTVYVLTQVDAFIYVLAVIAMLMMIRLGKTAVIVAAAGAILIQGYYIHQVMSLQNLESTYSESSSLSDSLDRIYFDSGAVIFVQIATIAYLVRPSTNEYFE